MSQSLNIPTWLGNFPLEGSYASVVLRIVTLMLYVPSMLSLPNMMHLHQLFLTAPNFDLLQCQQQSGIVATNKKLCSDQILKKQQDLKTPKLTETMSTFFKWTEKFSPGFRSYFSSVDWLHTSGLLESVNLTVSSSDPPHAPPTGYSSDVLCTLTLVILFSEMETCAYSKT